MNMNTTLAWLLTYAVHSSIALALMWVVSRFLRDRNLALEEAGWKVALFLTLLTTTLQLGLAGATEYRPLAGSLELSGAEGAGSPGLLTAPVLEPRPQSSELIGGVEEGAPDRALAAIRLARVGHVERLEPVDQAEDRAEAESAVGRGAGLRNRGTVGRGRAVTGILILWLIGTSILLVRFAVSYLLLRGRLKDRRMLVDGPFVALLGGLRARAGVVRSVGLSICARMSVPLALGLRHWEVCLPEKLTEEFDAAEQETVLAHELAHLVRYDTLWLLAARTLAGVFFFQPLHFVAFNRLRVLSELRCDDWAVESTGRPVTLARCLTRVASWRSSGWASLPVPAMAGSTRSHLGARVRRLVARSYPAPPARVPRWLKMAIAPLVILFVAAAPGVVERSRPIAPAAPVSPVPSASSLPSEVPAPLPELPAAGAPIAPSGGGPSESAPTPAPAPFTPPAEPADPARINEASPRVLAPPAPVTPVTRATPPVPAAPPFPAEPEDRSLPIAVSPQAPLSAPAVSRSPAPVAAPRSGAAAIRPASSAPAAVTSSAWLEPLPVRAAVPLATARFAVLSAGGSFVGSDEPPRAASESGPGGSRLARESDVEVERKGPEAELAAMKEALDAELEALEVILEREIEPVVGEFEGQMKVFESRIEERFGALFESFEEGLAPDGEMAADRMKALADRFMAQAESQRLHALGRALERRDTHPIRFEKERERALYEMGRKLESLTEGIWGEDRQRRFEEAMEARLRGTDLRMEAAARQMALDSLRLEVAGSAAERDRFRAEMLEEMKLAIPTREEMDKIRASVDRARTELALRMQELARAQADVHQSLEAWRKGHDRERIRDVE